MSHKRLLYLLMILIVLYNLNERLVVHHDHREVYVDIGVHTLAVLLMLSMAIIQPRQVILSIGVLLWMICVDATFKHIMPFQGALCMGPLVSWWNELRMTFDMYAMSAVVLTTVVPVLPVILLVRIMTALIKRARS